MAAAPRNCRGQRRFGLQPHLGQERHLPGNRPGHVGAGQHGHAQPGGHRQQFRDPGAALPQPPPAPGRQIRGVQQGEQGGDGRGPGGPAARHVMERALIQPEPMLNGVDPGGGQLARVRHRCVHRHPRPASVGCGDQLGDGLDRIRGLGVGPGGQVGEVSDHLDPPRPPAHFGDRCADQVSLGHRGVEQLRKVAARGSQEPAGRLQHGHVGPGPELEGHAAPRPDIADQGDPRLRPGEQVRARGALIQGHQAHRPGTDSRVGMSINQAGQDEATRQELRIRDRAVMDRARCVDPPRRRLVAEGKLNALHCPSLHPVTLATGH